MHSHHSDGLCSASELVVRSKKAGLSSISITDHDTISGIEEAIGAGRNLGVTVVPGVELSAGWQGGEIHILGYFIDCSSSVFLHHLASFRSNRLSRAEKIVARLNKLNIPISLETVLETAGIGAVGRPHIAQALVGGGFVANYQEVFQRYLGFGKPAYEEKVIIPAAAAIRLIREAGGVAIVAHPGFLDTDSLNGLMSAGLGGIEAVHPSHSSVDTERIRKVAESNSLLTSGGSDYHGGRRGKHDVLGKHFVHEKDLELMSSRAHKTS